MRRPPHSERLYKLVGRNVGQRRREAKLSQTKLAELCKLTRGSIANIELGNQRPTLHTLSTLAEALDVDMRALLPDRDELHQKESGAAESVITIREKKAAGGSQDKVASFIATSRQEVSGNAQSREPRKPTPRKLRSRRSADTRRAGC